MCVWSAWLLVAVVVVGSGWSRWASWPLVLISRPRGNVSSGGLAFRGLLPAPTPQQ
jgi:hypothetical protein